MKMRFMLSWFLFVLPFFCSAQYADNTNRKNEKNIYYRSLTEYIAYLKREKSIIPDTILIESDNFTDSLFNRIGKTKLVVVDYEELKKLLKKREELLVYRLFPLEYQSEYFSVSFVPGIVRYQEKENNFTLDAAGSYTVFFHYKDGKFYFDKIEDHQI